MNKIRRKALANIVDQLEAIKAELEEVLEQEEEARDNIPESMQETERYERAEEACDNLESAVYSFEELLEYISNATE